MMRAYRAELTKLLRRKVLLITAAVALVFGIGASAIVVNAAEPAAEPQRRCEPHAEHRGARRRGGGTQIFRSAISFAGFFVLVVFIGWTAVEFWARHHAHHVVAPTAPRAHCSPERSRHCSPTRR